MNEQKRVKLGKIRKKLKEAGITTKRKFIVLKCSKCSKELTVRTADKNRYTEEIVKKWVCPICK